MSKLRRILVVAALIMTGCAGDAIRRVSDHDRAFVYGSVLLPKGAPEFVMGGLTFGQRFAHVDPSGVFFIEDLKPEFFALMGFGYNNPSTTYNWPGDVKERTVPLKPRGMSYVGSFEVTDIDPGFGNNWTYKIVRVNKPTKVDILKKILKNPELEGTGWDDRIRSEIKKLAN
jgi:hypothetical protein